MKITPIVKRYLLTIVIMLGIAALWCAGNPFAVRFIRGFLSSTREMLVFLPLMFFLIGLFDAWVSREAVMRHIGKGSGLKGMALVILLATLQAGPLYGAFPVAYMLWKKGSSSANIFIYLGAFSTLKVPMVTFEIGFLGLKFSILRTLLTLPVFMLIGYLMEWYLKKKNFEVSQP